MKGKLSSSSRLVKSENKKQKMKNENSSSCNLFEDMLFSTRHEILKENYETLQRDHASLEENFKHVNEMNDLMKWHFENQTKELEEQNRHLLEEFESERSEIEKQHKKEIEEMEKTVNELKIKNQELLIAKEKKEEELKKSENKYKELTEEFSKVEKECSELKSLFQESNKKNLMGVDHDVNKTATDKTMIIDDDSDVEYHHNPPRKTSNIIITPPQCPVVGVKQEEQSDGTNSSKVEIKRTDESKELKTKKIFVGGIPKTVTEERSDEFKELFAKYGTVVDHEIIRDHETKMSRGFGFVVFDKEEIVDELLSKGKTIDMGDTQMTIKKAVPKKSSTPTPYGGSYGGFDGGYGLIRGPPSRFAWGYGYGDGYGYRNETPFGNGRYYHPYGR